MKRLNFIIIKKIKTNISAEQEERKASQCPSYMWRLTDWLTERRRDGSVIHRHPVASSLLQVITLYLFVYHSPILLVCCLLSFILKIIINEWRGIIITYTPQCITSYSPILCLLRWYGQRQRPRLPFHGSAAILLFCKLQN